MDTRGRNDLDRFLGEERAQQGRMRTEDSGVGWARFIIGPTVGCLGLRGERQIWVEFDPGNSVEVLLGKLKASLGINSDVGLYLKGFFIQPQLKASLLLKVQDPVVLLPAGQTQFAFGRGIELPQSAIAYETPPPEQTFSFNPERVSTPIAAGRGNEVPQSVVENTQQPSTGERAIVTLPISPTPGTEASSPAGARISEMNSVTKPEDQAVSPSAGTQRGRPRGRKLKLEPMSPGNDGKALLENPNTVNEVVPVRRSSRRVSIPAIIIEGGRGKKKRGAADDENVNPQQPKRLKSTSGKDTDSSDVELLTVSPVAKKRGRQSKKAKNLAELSNKIAVKLEELLGSDEAEAESGHDSTAGAGDTTGAELSTSVFEDRTLELDTSKVEKNDSILGRSLLTVSQLAEQYDQAMAELGGNVHTNAPVNQSSTPENEQPSNSSEAPESMQEFLTISSEQIAAGSVIQADMLLAYEDGTQVMVTHVMKVLAKDGEALSVVPPTAFIQGGIDISQAFNLSFSDLIQPRLIDEAQFQALVDAHGLVEIDTFDENML